MTWATICLLFLACWLGGVVALACDVLQTRRADRAPETWGALLLWPLLGPLGVYQWLTGRHRA